MSYSEAVGLEGTGDSDEDSSVHTGSWSMPNATANGETRKYNFNQQHLIQPRVPRRMQIVPYSSLAPHLEDAESLGSGGFGVVYEVEWMDQAIAVKKLAMTEKNHIAGDFIREVIVLGTIAHPNIVPLVGVSCDEHNRCLMYELMSGGSLADRIALSDPTRRGEYADQQLLPFPWQERIQVLLDGVLGLACLHECTLLHCDIKPENILIRDNGRAAVADFGLSRSLRGAEYKGSHGFTPGYADPYWSKERKYTTASDIYAVGVVIQQTLTGRGAKRLQDIRQEAMRQTLTNAPTVPISRGLLRKRETPVGTDFAQAEAARKKKELQCAQRDILLRHFLQQSAGWPRRVASELTMLSVACTSFKPEQRPSIGEVLDRISTICNSPDAADVWPELDDLALDAEQEAQQTTRRHSAKQWGSQLRESLEEFQRAKTLMLQKREQQQNQERIQARRQRHQAAIESARKHAEKDAQNDEVKEPHAANQTVELEVDESEVAELQGPEELSKEAEDAEEAVITALDALSRVENPSTGEVLD